jgi:nucleotide-binding universal stress UspA family protein
VSRPLRLLVATDGSPAAQRAVEWSANFAGRTDADVILAHVVSSVAEWMMSVAQIDFMRVEAEHRFLLDGLWSEPLRNAGVRYRTHLTRGDPVKCLLDFAENADADLVVIGKTGRTAAGDFLLGGSAMRLAHRSTRPLILVPELGPDPDDASDPAVRSNVGRV